MASSALCAASFADAPRASARPSLRGADGSPPAIERSQRTALESQLLRLAQAFDFYSGVYLHLGHCQGPVQPERLFASSVIARRRFGDTLANSQVARRAACAYKPFAWNGTDETDEALREIDAAIAVPVQDHARGPALVTLLGIDIERARILARVEGPQLSALATDLHVLALAGLSPARDRAGLTTREIACLRLAAVGRTVSDTAEALGITPRTVEFHLRNLSSKLGAANKTHAVALAVSQGLLQL